MCKWLGKELGEGRPRVPPPEIREEPNILSLPAPQTGTNSFIAVRQINAVRQFVPVPRLPPCHIRLGSNYDAIKVPVDPNGIEFPGRPTGKLDSWIFRTGFIEHKSLRSYTVRIATGWDSHCQTQDGTRNVFTWHGSKAFHWILTFPKDSFEPPIPLNRVCRPCS